MRPSYLSILAFSGAVSVCAYDLHLFPAQSSYDHDREMLRQNLGLAEEALIIEDFEDHDFVSGLKTSFAATEENTETSWEGNRIGGPFDQAKFDLELPGVRLFGIAISDNDGGQETVRINENEPLQLRQLPFFTVNSSGRAYYLLILATEDDPDIRSVSFNEAFSIHCDALMLGQVDRTESDDHAIYLRDRSRLIGKLNILRVEISTSEHLTPLKVPLDRISAINVGSTESLSTIELINNDSINGILQHSTWNLDSSLGKLHISHELIDSIRPFRDQTRFFNEAALAKRVQPPNPNRIAFLMQDALARGIDRFPFQPVTRENSQFDKVWAFKDQDKRSISSLQDIISDRNQPVALRKIAICAALANKSIDQETLKIIEEITTAHPKTFPIPADNQISNSEFESDLPFEGRVGQRSILPGEDSLPGWSVVEGRVVLRQLRRLVGVTALELGPSTLPGAITQFFRTRPKQRYRVEISASGPMNDRKGNTRAQIEVEELKEIFDSPVGDVQRPLNFEFTARHQFSTITLRGIGNAAYGPMIEKISITPIH